MPKIMEIGWQLTKLLQKLSGLLFLAHPVLDTGQSELRSDIPDIGHSAMAVDRL